MAKDKTTIDFLSVPPLFIETLYNGTHLSNATGFVIERAGEFFLVTNWHVLSGRHAKTNKILHSQAAIPNKIQVMHQVNGQLGSWLPFIYDILNEDGSPRWFTHERGCEIDVALLKIVPAKTPQCDMHPLDLKLADVDLVLGPSEPISIIGFPFGVASSGRIPIWKTGHIASDLDIDYDGKPVFLIDVTTKEGMSGSPVIARRSGIPLTSTGFVLGGANTKFLGVYSSRVPDAEGSEGKDYNLGMAWKAHVIDEILSRIPKS